MNETIKKAMKNKAKKYKKLNCWPVFRGRNKVN